MSLSQSDLVLMMRQMMEVTQAASTAAQAALAATKDASKSGLAGADMARLLPKPDVFKPANREAEHGEWSAWFWTLKQYLGALDAAFTDELTFIERNPTKDLSAEAYASLESERRSKQLFALLSSLIRGRGLQIIQRIPVQNGFEALRQLVQLYQPASKTRSLGILSALTSMGHFRAGEPLLPQVLDMERIMDEYERSSSKKLDDDFKSSEKGKGKGKQQSDGKGKNEKGGKGNQQQKGGSWNQQQKGGNWNQPQKGSSWNQQQKGNWNRVNQVHGAGSEASTSVPSTVGPSPSQVGQTANVHRVQLESVVEVDLTEEEVSIQYFD
ncbi:unnamed protein product, partial [Symbiodinium microadriaticum]